MFSQDAQSGRRRLSAGWMSVAALLAGVVAGCTDRPTILPNSDAELRKTNAQFAADAAKRTYPASAAKGGDAKAQASVDHGFTNKIDVINLAEEDWSNVELWINGNYVIFIPHWANKEMKTLSFKFFFDRDGQHFPTNNKETRVEKIEILKDGKVYNIPMKMAD